MQLAQEAGEELTVFVVEIGSEIGAHILAGTIFEPTALKVRGWNVRFCLAPKVLGRITDFPWEPLPHPTIEDRKAT